MHTVALIISLVAIIGSSDKTAVSVPLKVCKRVTPPLPLRLATIAITLLITLPVLHGSGAGGSLGGGL